MHQFFVRKIEKLRQVTLELDLFVCLTPCATLLFLSLMSGCKSGSYGNIPKYHMHIQMSVNTCVWWSEDEAALKATPFCLSLSPPQRGRNLCRYLIWLARLSVDVVYIHSGDLVIRFISTGLFFFSFKTSWDFISFMSFTWRKEQALLEHLHQT